MQSHKDISTEDTTDRSTTEDQASAGHGGLDWPMHSTQAASEPSDGALESLIALKEEISGLSATILQALASTREPVDALVALNAILAERFEEVWEMLHVPAQRLERRKAQGATDGAAANQDIPLDEEERAKQGGQGPRSDSEETGAQPYQVAQEPGKQEPARGNLKLTFYRAVLGSIAEAMLEEKSIGKPAVSTFRDHRLVDVNQLFFAYLVCHANDHLLPEHHHPVPSPRRPLR